jgi:hypothetical protein
VCSSDLSPSSQGFETSIGFEGLSFDWNAKGNYAHLGKGGRYYLTAARSSNRTRNRSPKIESQNNIPPLAQNAEPSLHQDRNSKYSAELNVSSSKELVNQLRSKQKRLPVWTLAVLFSLIPKFGIFISILLVPLLYFIVDKPRKTTLLYYDIAPEAEENVQLFFRNFNELATCHSAWYVVSEQKVDVVKYNAGASWLVKRRRLKIQYRVPPLLKTNILVPCLFLGKQKLYFLPDQVLIQKHSNISSIPYSKLTILQKNVKFIEEQRIAPESKKVGRTWRFVNIDGGPDRRFKYNRELPMLLYSELSLKSTNVIDAVILLSKPDVGSQLERAIHSYASSDFLSEMKS